MVTTTNVVNQLMEDAADAIYDLYSYMGTGTGTASIADTATQLTAGVTIQSLSFNKIRDSGITGSFLNGRNMTMLFTLEPGEPVTQPIAQGEIGLFKQATSGAGLGVGAKLNVTQTKDNTVKQRWRMTLSFVRISEV